MAQKSLTLNSGFNRLMSLLTVSFPASHEYLNELRDGHVPETEKGEPVFHIWPDIPNRTMNPHERMQADMARMRQTTTITQIR